MPRKPGTQRFRIRLRPRTVMLASASVVVAGVLGLGLAATCRPAWYRPQPIDRANLRDDKRDLVGLLDEIGAALNQHRRLSFRLDEEQVNRWITARGEMWPEARTDLGPLQHPQISFHDGAIRAAAQVGQGGLQGVVSATCRVSVDGDRVVIERAKVRLGSLPVPRTWLTEWIAQIPEVHSVPSRDSVHETLVLDNDWVWPNGRRRFRLASLRLSDGVADVVLEPWPGDR